MIDTGGKLIRTVGNKRYYSDEEAAEFMGVSVEEVRELAEKGKIIRGFADMVNGGKYFTGENIAAWINTYSTGKKTTDFPNYCGTKFVQQYLDLPQSRVKLLISEGAFDTEEIFAVKIRIGDRMSDVWRVPLENVKAYKAWSDESIRTAERETPKTQSDGERQEAEEMVINLRRLLFKGRNESTEEWAEGGIYQTYAEDEICIGQGDEHRVKRETLRQWTGLVDRKRQRIFDGDVIKLASGKSVGLYVVEWDWVQARYTARGANTGFCTGKAYEVISDYCKVALDADTAMRAEVCGERSEFPLTGAEYGSPWR